MRRWLALLLVPLLAPSALAQEPMAVTTDAPKAPLEPGGEEVPLTVRVEVPCQTLSQARGTVALSVTHRPDWAAARVEPDHLEPPMGAPCAMAWSGEARLLVSARAAAPALRDDVVSVTARLGDVERSAHAAVKAAFRSDLAVEAEDAPKSAKPQSVVTFDVRVTNRGNGPTKIVFDVGATPGFQTPQPGSIILQSPLDGPENAATVAIMVQTPYHPGRVDEEGVITARVVPVYALDPQLAGAAQTLTFRVHAIGTYVPGAGAALAVGALALLALARRR